MRRRQMFAKLFKERLALDPSGATSGPAAVSPSPPPVSREEEEAKAAIWSPSVDPTAAVLVKKRGRPKGSKNKVKQ